MSGQHVLLDLRSNVDPGQHLLHGPFWFKKYFERSTCFGNFCPNVDLGQHLDFTGGQHVFGISVPNVDPGQHLLHGPLWFKKYFERSTCFREFSSKCWPGSTSFTWPFNLECFWAVNIFSRFLVQMLTRVNIVYMDLFIFNFLGGQHVFGIFGPNVDPGQHRLHGPFYF